LALARLAVAPLALGFARLAFALAQLAPVALIVEKGRA
jgi:hypothetical protein